MRKKWVRRKCWINTDVCWIHREQVPGRTLSEKYSSGKCNLFITCVREKETKKSMFFYWCLHCFCCVPFKLTLVKQHTSGTATASCDRQYSGFTWSHKYTNLFTNLNNFQPKQEWWVESTRLQSYKYLSMMLLIYWFPAQQEEVVLKL